MPCELNPATGRCIYAEKGEKYHPDCEVNPETNRCRKRTRQTKRKGRKEEKVKPYKCPPGKIYNRKTKKCVKKEGAVGKSILAQNVVKTIGGPISLHYYVVKMGGVTRKIFLIGDEHTKYKHHEEPGIISITTLLKKVIRRSPHCIDLFSEIIYYQGEDVRAAGKGIQGYSDPLTAVRREFGSCPYHNLSKRKCQYPNLRYQTWDLRFTLKNPGNLLGPRVSNPFDEILWGRGTLKRLRTDFSDTTLIKYILGMPLTRTKKAAMDDFFAEEFKKKAKDKKFQTEVGDPAVMERRKATIQKEYAKVMKSVKFPKDLLKTFIKSYQSTGDDNYTVIFTDFYMICRMFMKFDKTQEKIDRSPKGCPMMGKIGETAETPKHIIVYAGDSHIENVQTFIEEMFDVFPVYSTGDTKYGSKKLPVRRLEAVDQKTHEYLEPPQTVDELFEDFYD